MGKVTRIAIIGALGRMGSAIIKASVDIEHVVISHALIRNESEKISTSVAQDLTLNEHSLNSSTALNYTSLEDLEVNDFDIMIDFTSTDLSIRNAIWCAKHNKPILIGTTGFSDAQIQTLQALHKDAAILLSANTSLGVNVVINLLEQAAKAIGKKSDIEIIEAHHRNKVDAPSGTALKMADAICQTLGLNLEDNGVFSRNGHTGARNNDDIGFSTIRAGDIIGEHTVLFSLPGERIEITHKATNRQLFALGAIETACWLSKQAPGWYTMQDSLNLK